MLPDLSWWTCGTCHYYAASNEREGLCCCEPSKFPRVVVQSRQRGCAAHEQLTRCSKCGSAMLMAADVFRRDASVCDDCAMPELELITETAALPRAGVETETAVKPRGRGRKA